MKINTKSEGPIQQSGTNIEEIKEFVYLETYIGESMADVLTRISKAKGGYAALRNILRTQTPKSGSSRDKYLGTSFMALNLQK